MAADEDARNRARARVGDELVRRRMSPRDLARDAGVDFDTVGDFLNGKRWPQPARRGMISAALGWADTGIDQIVRGEEPAQAGGYVAGHIAGSETVVPPSQDDGVLLSMPPEALAGLGPAEREEVIAAAKLSALQTARAIRRRLDGEGQT